MKKIALIAFLFFSLFHLSACLVAHDLLSQLSKPFLLLFLFLYYNASTSTLNSGLNFYIKAGLLFSLVGDCLLLFAIQKEVFFILGLVAFLIAHVNYSIAFFKEIQISTRKPSRKVILWSVLPYSIIVACSIVFFNSSLGTLFMPVVFYMVVIGTMASLASMRISSVSWHSYMLVLTGAVFFIISDFILAYNKFYQVLGNASFYIMLTYLLAQFAIVRGMIVKTKADVIK